MTDFCSHTSFFSSDFSSAFSRFLRTHLVNSPWFWPILAAVSAIGRVPMASTMLSVPQKHVCLRPRRVTKCKFGTSEKASPGQKPGRNCAKQGEMPQSSRFPAVFRWEQDGASCPRRGMAVSLDRFQACIKARPVPCLGCTRPTHFRMFRC